MKMRMPSVPLITVDPYFSVWTHDCLNDRFPTHWTGARNAMLGTVTVDGERYRFLGQSGDKTLPQVSLDSRENYTKSDWTVWAASLTGKKEDLAFFAHHLWLAYHTMRTREAMTDWYFTDTSEMRSFRHRTVQGGLFIRLMFRLKRVVCITTRFLRTLAAGGDNVCAESWDTWDRKTEPNGCFTRSKRWNIADTIRQGSPYLKRDTSAS